MMRRLISPVLSLRVMAVSLLPKMISISVETKMAFTDLTVSRMLEGTNNRFYYGLNANRYELDYNQYWGTADTNYHVFKKTLSKSSSTATKYNLQVWIDGTSRRSQSNMSNPANAVTGNVFIIGRWLSWHSKKVSISGMNP